MMVQRISLLWTLAAITIFGLSLLTLWSEQSAKETMVLASKSGAIGLSLSVAGGTVSKRLADGSFKDLGQIEGDKKYVKMMARLSKSESQHLSPPYSSMEEIWADAPRRAWRALRKKAGLPASSDVGILAKLIKRLLALSSADGSTPSSSVVISYPGIIALYEEDIIEAAQYLGNRLLTGYHHRQPREVVACYAGHGMGLCTNYEDKQLCEQQGQQLPLVSTLHVEITDHALLLHGEQMRTAIELRNQEISAAASFDLGTRNLLGEGYAEAIREFVSRFILQLDWRNLKTSELLVIISGQESAVEDGIVSSAVRAAAEEYVVHVRLVQSNPLYVAARGAAELAWRAQVAFEY